MSRIIAGAAAGRPLTAVPGTGTRPTTDRTKEALFSWLEARDWLDGTAVLDLYAGSGALGCEAASRGAASVLLVERDRRAVAACRANAALVNRARGADVVRVRAGSVEQALAAEAAPVVQTQVPSAAGGTDAAACESQGGKMLPLGRLQTVRCVITYADAGHRCTDSDQCTGDCRLPPATRPQPVMMIPENGSTLSSGRKESVSSEARQISPLTAVPTRGREPDRNRSKIDSSGMS